MHPSSCPDSSENPGGVSFTSTSRDIKISSPISIPDPLTLPTLRASCLGSGRLPELFPELFVELFFFVNFSGFVFLSADELSTVAFDELGREAVFSFNTTFSLTAVAAFVFLAS